MNSIPAMTMQAGVMAQKPMTHYSDPLLHMVSKPSHQEQDGVLLTMIPSPRPAEPLAMLLKNQAAHHPLDQKELRGTPKVLLRAVRLP